MINKIYFNFFFVDKIKLKKTLKKSIKAKSKERISLKLFVFFLSNYSFLVCFLLFLSCHSTTLINTLKNLHIFIDFEYGRIDGQSKVPYNLFGEQSSYKISATHMWTLVRIFPKLCGHFLKNCEYYLHFLNLIEIFREMCCDFFDRSKIDALQKKISLYLEEFLRLFPNEKIRPKQHFMTHYPTAILKFGPPKFYTVIRFEAKHQPLKRIGCATHNRINILKSIAERHQCSQVFHLTAPDYFNQYQLGSHLTLNYHLVDFIEQKLNSKKNFYYKYIQYNGLKYTVDDLVITGKNGEMPIFSRIICLLNNKNSFLF